ncbi:single-stranded DNA-binding protein [Acidaminococcus intestini]|jgi:single-strand DNA-binding protein|uniref:single-stranded DNA-binding protein n=1 Tax=Acidaminococcus intestini TaxID=187327 RepID=UPI0020653261|nr:single-stranded DNA-binding protein [Acidaminococcus intestini]DAY99411.1 MAG TPA: Single strand binding protein [Caudoviricetes sp.]
MNNVNLMGRLTRDPEARTTQSGQSVASFTLAVDRSTKGPKGEKETDFINCVAFGKTAEVVCTYVSKGQRLIVQGRIQTGSYTDKNGNKRYTTNISVSTVEFVEKKERHDQSPMDSFGDGRAKSSWEAQPMQFDEEVPF